MERTRILVNATTLVVGGGIQIGVSFIEIASNEKELDLLFLVSKGIFENLNEGLKTSSKVKCFKNSPSHPLKGFKTRWEIREIERDYKPDIVYSIGFPSYIRFKTIEIGRYTNPWEINPEPLPWDILGGKLKQIKIRIGVYYRIFWAKNADYIETQTEGARLGIKRRVGFPYDKVKVIHNSPNQMFINAGRVIKNKDIVNRENIIFSLSAPHTHKNLDLIPFVAKELKHIYPNPPVFILTLPENSFLWKRIDKMAKELGVNGLIINVGQLRLSECIDYYKKAKIVFLPTLLEIFSATYVEAMAMKVPIVTTDLDFARDNCGDGALYFEPRNPGSAAYQISKLLNDSNLYYGLIDKALIKLNTYPSVEEKYNNLFNWFKEISKNNGEHE